MTSPENHLLHVIILYLLLHSATTTATSDLTTLIYKGCANQNFQNPLSSQHLKSLYTSLLSQSSTTNFYKTTVNTVTGLYQCRSDLSNSDCDTCVKTLPETISRVCNTNTMAARVQLVGCYMRYEAIGFPQVPGTELLYKKCGSGRVDDEKLDGAFALLTKGVGKGYFAGEYENVYVLGQCDGDLGGGDCVNCVKNAADIGRSECRSSVSGRVFLFRCFVSYTYYPDGVPGSGGVGGGVGVQTTVTEIDSGGGNHGRSNTQKTVAIVFGGLAGLGMLMALLLVVKSAFKKKKEQYQHQHQHHKDNHNHNHNNNQNHNHNHNQNQYYSYGGY